MLIIPVIEERLVVEKRWVLTEELHVRRREHIEEVEIPVELRSTRVSVERAEAAQQPDAIQIDSHSYQGRVSRLRSLSMSIRTITALFDSADDANRARDRLLEIGLPSDAVQVIYQGRAANVPGRRQGTMGEHQGLLRGR